MKELNEQDKMKLHAGLLKEEPLNEVSGKKIFKVMKKIDNDWQNIFYEMRADETVQKSYKKQLETANDLYFKFRAIVYQIDTDKA